MIPDSDTMTLFVSEYEALRARAAELEHWLALALAVMDNKGLDWITFILSVTNSDSTMPGSSRLKTKAQSVNSCRFSRTKLSGRQN